MEAAPLRTLLRIRLVCEVFNLAFFQLHDLCRSSQERCEAASFRGWRVDACLKDGCEARSDTAFCTVLPVNCIGADRLSGEMLTQFLYGCECRGIREDFFRGRGGLVSGQAARGNAHAVSLRL